MNDDKSLPGATDPRALREMIREAALDREPELDWDRIATRLFAEIEDGEVSHSKSALPGELCASELSAEASAVRPSHAPDVGGSPAVDAPTGSHSPIDPVPWKEGQVAARSIAPALGEPRVNNAPGVDGPSRSEEDAASSRWSRWVAVLAVAAAFVGLWLSHERSNESPSTIAIAEPIDTSQIPMAPGLEGARDLDALKAGDIVEAPVGPVVFGKSGSLEWTLAAGGRLVVRRGLQSGIHELELESGSLRGMVAPGASMPLVITAGETEMVSLGAGSVFSVTRSSKRVVMHLEEGSASVGRRSVPSISRPWELADRVDGRVFTAPMVGAFSLDGGDTFELLPTEIKTALSEPKSAAVFAPAVTDLEPRRDVALAGAASSEPIRDAKDAPSSAPVRAQVSVPPAAPAIVSSAEPAVSTTVSAPPASPGATSDATARSSILGCIAKIRNERQARAADGVRILVDSTLRVVVSEEGAVKSAVFNPPLEADLQGCAVFLLRTKLEPGARVLSIPVSLH